MGIIQMSRSEDYEDCKILPSTENKKGVWMGSAWIETRLRQSTGHSKSCFDDVFSAGQINGWKRKAEVLSAINNKQANQGSVEILKSSLSKQYQTKTSHGQTKDGFKFS